MKEQIVIGSGGSGLAAQAALQNLGHNDMIIIDAENVKKEQLPFPKSEPFILHNPYPPELKSVYEGKQFECKGKHQYRLVDTVKKDMGEGVLVTEIWKCQCGKVLGSYLSPNDQGFVPFYSKLKVKI